MARLRISLVLATLLLTGGCVSYQSLDSGPQDVDGLKVVAGSGWIKAPRSLRDRKGTQVWTRNGMLLDRLLLIPGVPDGEPLLVDRSQNAALPVFRADMLPNELTELAESTLLKYFGEGATVVDTSGLRPHKFGERQGFMFDFKAVLGEMPEYGGTVGALIADGPL